MARAKDLIALAEQLASKLSSVPSSSASDARVALQESTELLGLNTPIVTKEIAGGGGSLLGGTCETGRGVFDVGGERYGGEYSSTRGGCRAVD